MYDKADVFYTVTGMKKPAGSQKTEEKMYEIPTFRVKGKIHTI